MSNHDTMSWNKRIKGHTIHLVDTVLILLVDFSSLRGCIVPSKVIQFFDLCYQYGR